METISAQKKQNSRSLAVYTFSHFAVDMACFVLLFGAFRPGRTGQEAAVGFLCYDIAAFGLQPFIGLAYDVLRARVRPAALGCAMLAAAFALWSVPWAAILLAGLGNAFFHVGGGADTLRRAQGRALPNGIFVSSGALGVTLGTLAGRAGAIPPWAFAALALGCGIAVQMFCPEAARRGVPPARAGRVSPGWAIALLLAAVALRSYFGAAYAAPWQGMTGAAVLLGAVCAMGGKALGGALGDRFGMRRAGLVTLAASLVCCLPWGGIPAAAVGVVLFNCSMPLTLTALAGYLPESPGFAFGLTTLALLAGIMPAFFAVLPAAAAAPVCAAVTVLTAACLFFALTDKKGANK